MAPQPGCSPGALAPQAGEAGAGGKVRPVVCPCRESGQGLWVTSQASTIWAAQRFMWAGHGHHSWLQVSARSGRQVEDIQASDSCTKSFQLLFMGCPRHGGPRGCRARALALPGSVTLHLCPLAFCFRGQGSWLRVGAEPSASCPPAGAETPTLRSSRPSFSTILRKGGRRAGSASQQLPMRVCTEPGQPSGGSMR